MGKYLKKVGMFFAGRFLLVMNETGCLFVLVWFGFCFLRPGFLLRVALAVLNLSLWTRLPSKKEVCLPLLLQLLGLKVCTIIA